MKKIIMGIQVGNRFEDVEKVQNLLTEYGCFIKTRLGLHQQAEFKEICTEKGLIILEMVRDSDEKSMELKEKLNEINEVVAKTMEF
ncbi:hypothetical protein [Dethiothermospora halolimnae]|uniref:hypothetical protein n=1 Tax=Dethiothermospora halolimnae TaxID=3114390 RepID=UPI003CCBC68C